LQSIQSNNLFRQANTRTASVNDTRNIIKQYIRGQIMQERE